MSRKKKKALIKDRASTKKVRKNAKPGKKITRKEPPGIEQRVEAKAILNEKLRPKIIFAKDAWEDIWTAISFATQTEVTFLGEVYYDGEGTYYIDRIYVFRQFVNANYAELALEGEGCKDDYIEKLAAGIKIDGYEFTLNTERCFVYPPQFFFHGHLHPGTLLEHSSTDNNGYLTIHRHEPYFIDAIFTRDGKFRVWFYGLGGFIVIENCQIAVEENSCLSALDREIRNSVIEQMVAERLIPIREVMA